MMTSLLADAGLTPATCANLLGVDPVRFESWSSGARELPGFIVPELASILGVSREALIKGELSKAPAIWYKFRGEQLVDADRELIVLIRRMGFYIHQLGQSTGSLGSSWEVHFRLVRQKLDQHKLDSPSIQGEVAAELFRANVGLGYGSVGKDDRVIGPGDIIRGIVRSMGILLIEMPVPDSNMDGCSFYVGDAGCETPCLFVNTYRQGWFRRNYVIAHELAHAIFDIDGEAALIDYRGSSGDPSIKEARADSFARTLFASKKVINVLTSRLGLKWESLSTRDLALIVANAQVDLKVILRAAAEHGVINSDQVVAYNKRSLKRDLRMFSEHALTPTEYFARYPSRALWSADLRTTTIPSRDLRLPVPYIVMVLNAVNDGFISEGKAAEMLMMDYDVFLQRFGELIVEIAA